ncbi:MAG: hypothetical protein JNG83_10960 [Opitutaceae bacterium]|nr:hypothetical protein [Opitutaceae bacterium]
MRDDKHRFLSLIGQLPVRLTSEQAAWVLGCQAHDVSLLLAAKLLKPLGNPQPNSVKYFAATEILENGRDRGWLSRVTATLGEHWRRKNGRGEELGSDGGNVSGHPK